MEQQVKSDWIINNLNIFGLQQDINLSISSIQYEILNQVEGENIQFISDYLGAEIDISKELRLNKNLTIEKIFTEFLGFENINPFNQNTFKCSLILGCLQLSLFKEYIENKHKNILTFSEYETQYNSLLNNFLNSNIDTDEQDFIKAELTLCNKLLIELNKPVYSELSLLNKVLDKPCEYKKNLINSIDKRKKFLEQKANAKYPKIKALFQFIEYLHSNIQNFNQYSGLIKELEILKDLKNKLKPEQNYKDKQQYDKVQVELESKFKTLQDNTANLIKAKAIELNVCNFENEPIYSFNGLEDELQQLKINFSGNDLTEIFKYKTQYFEYRTQTHDTFLSLQSFFYELDKIAKSFFNYFKDTEHNEFEAFDTKAIPVNSIAEAIQRFKNGQTNFTLTSSTLFNTTSNRQLKTEDISPQQNTTPKPTETDLSEKIKKHFAFFTRNCPRKHKQILNDSDFEKLIMWTIWYFENDFEVPEISEPINVVNTNKTFVQLAFKYLFKELHKSSPYPKTLFKFYQSAFKPYSDDKKSNFEAVKNNDEVKKLMQIDY